MSNDATLLKRLTDLRVMARYIEGQLLNKSGGIWEKFSTGGVDNSAPPSDAEDDTIPAVTKTDDPDILDFDAIYPLFDREAVGKVYKDAVDKKEAAGVAMRAKRQSDALSSMQQAMILRYSSRIRHIGAALSRRKSLADADIELMQLDLSR